LILAKDKVTHCI